MNKISFVLCLAALMAAPLLFGSVYAFAYTTIFLLILIAGLLAMMDGVRKASATGVWRLEMPTNPLWPLFLAFFAYLILQMIPLPGVMLTHLSVVAKVVSEKSLPSWFLSGISVHDYWDTLAPYIYPVRMSLVRWIVYGIFLWSFAVALDSRKRIEWAVIIFLVLSCLESLYGIVQSYSGYEHIWWYKKLDHVGFPTGTYVNHNHFAGMMEMGVILSVAYAVLLYDRHRKRQRGTRKRLKNLTARIAYLFSEEQLYTRIFLVVFTGVIIGLGLILSGSRGGILSAGTALAVMGIFFVSRKNYRKPGLYILIPFLLMTAIYAVFAGIDPTVNRFYLFDADMLNRTVLAEKAVNMFEDYPLFGVGFGNLPYLYPKYQDVLHQNLFVNYAHNDWAQLLAEGGIAGFILLIAGIGWYLVWVIRKWKSSDNAFAVCLGIAPVIAVISLGIHSYSDFNLHMPANMILLIAVIAVGVRALLSSEGRTGQGRIAIPLGGRAAVIIVFILAITAWSGMWTIRHFVAEAYCNTIQTPPLNLNQEPEVASIRKAIVWDGGNSRYRFKMAQALMQLRDKENQTAPSADEKYSVRIIENLEAAIRLNPFMAEYHVLLGWEYSYLWRHRDYMTVWLPAADVCMERASFFNGAGTAHPRRHIDLGKYWTMRSATLRHDQEKYDSAVMKARWHFKRALDLMRTGETKKEITGYVKTFCPDQGQQRAILE